MTSPIAGMDLIFEDDVLRVTRSGDPQADTVTLCFTGLRQRLGGFGPEEFVGSARLGGAAAIFVTDKAGSWYNAIPAERLVDILTPHIAGRRINTLGNSMGGFGAIWITRYLPVATALAFAPQYSMHPDIVTGETRWQNARAKIRAWRYPSLDGHFVATTDYITISGTTDRVQTVHLPDLPNMRHFIVADTDHTIAATLKARGVLHDVIVAAFTGAEIAPLLGPGATAAA